MSGLAVCLQQDLCHVNKGKREEESSEYFRSKEDKRMERRLYSTWMTIQLLVCVCEEKEVM